MDAIHPLLTGVNDCEPPGLALLMKYSVRNHRVSSHLIELFDAGLVQITSGTEHEIVTSTYFSDRGQALGWVKRRRWNDF
jgi:hypothetical protein